MLVRVLYFSSEAVVQYFTSGVYLELNLGAGNIRLGRYCMPPSSFHAVPRRGMVFTGLIVCSALDADVILIVVASRYDTRIET